jgi:hypothetical protein
LLAVVAVLAALRFVVVPWVQAQSEQRQYLELVTQRLDRSSAVVHNREQIGKAVQKIGTVEAGVRAPFPRAASPDAYRLDAQRAITTLAESAGAKVTLFDWLVDGEVPEARLAYARVRVTLGGTLAEIVRAHGDLEGALPNAAVREISLEAREPARSVGNADTTATLVVDLYFDAAASASLEAAP